jgi:DNA-binding PadR family transcriptional regulator
MPTTPKVPAPSHLAPLSEVAWELLLSLSAGERHGYAILLDVEERTGGRLRLLPGSLYRALHRLLADGWVEVVPDAAATREDSRRTVYRLTGLGRQVATLEAARLAGSLRTARQRGLLAEENRG